ncbi:MAG: hypothetical protein ACK55Z_23755, partial [bacterium]
LAQTAHFCPHGTRARTVENVNSRREVSSDCISPSPRAARTQPVATPPQSSCVDPPCRKEPFRGAAVSHGTK